MKHTLQLYKAEVLLSLPLPFVDQGIRAGFPSPAQDYIDNTIDLNKHLVKNPSSTFYARVVGDSMIDEDIKEGDILVIDKSLTAENNDLAVCCIDGEFTLKRVVIEKEIIWLVPSNKDYPKIKVTPDDNFIIWGVVLYTIKQNRKRRK